MTRLTKTIWKFCIPIGNVTTIKMPAGAKVLHVAAQRNTPCLWALVDPSAPLEPRHFRLTGTGHPIRDLGEAEHRGTFLMAGDRLVLHLFEYPNDRPEP